MRSLRTPTVGPLSTLAIVVAISVPAFACRLPFLPAVTISAPVAGTGTVSGTSDAPTVVGSHAWVVTSDEATGATLTVQADSFAHVVQTAKTAAVRLGLTKTGGSSWSVGTGQSTSAEGIPATVTASSSSAGDASFSIDVTFAPGDVSVLPSGNYTTSIVGTIMANP